MSSFDEEMSMLLQGFEGGDDDQDKIKLPEMDYSYLNGLRGIGALCVYFDHFRFQFFPYPTQEDIDNGEDVRHLPDFLYTTPVAIIHHGYFWVLIFFILSGFVLPLRFFKTRDTLCIYSGTFRRYLRLMIPCVIILSLYYFFMKMDAMGPYTFTRIQGKTYLHLLIDGFFGTWLCDDSWTSVSWTLSVELAATFFIYLLAQTAVQYRARFLIYFLVCCFFWIPQITDKVGITNLDFGKTVVHLPVFFLGVILADFETMKDSRPLDAVRNLKWWWKIPINLFLVFVIVSLGSYKGNGRCLNDHDGNCEYWHYVTLNFALNKLFYNYVAAVALIFFALTSSSFQWVLGSSVFSFLGRISYTLYLLHELFTEWIEVDTYYYFIGPDHDIDPNLAILYVFLIYTPALILASWILTLLVDAPSQKWVYQLEEQARKQRPPPPQLEEDAEEKPDFAEYYSCWSFTKRSWPIFLLATWLIIVLITTEIYSKFKSERLVGPDEVKPWLSVTS